MKRESVVTNCVFAAIAAGDVTDAKAALTKTIVKDAQYTPDAEKSALYRRLFKLKTRLVHAAGEKRMTDGRAAVSVICP